MKKYLIFVRNIVTSNFDHINSTYFAQMGFQIDAS